MNKKDQPVTNKKIVGVICVILVLGLFLIVIANTSNNLLSAARSFVDGKGIWTTAQKNATLELIQYTQYEDTEDYQEFDDYFDVYRGYQQARKELSSENPDPEIILEGFQKGGRYNPEDIEDIIWIYQNFGWSPRLQRATKIWKQTESLMGKLEELGISIREKIQAGPLQESEKRAYLQRIFELDNKLTQHEENFAATVSQASILITKVVYWATLGIGLLILAGGGFVTLQFLRNVREWGDLISESEQKFRHVLENTQDILYELNVYTNEYEYVSPSAKKVLGYSAETLQKEGPQFIFNRIHPDDLERLEEELQQVKGQSPADNYVEEIGYRIKNKSGEYIWINNNRTIFLDENNNAHKVVGSVRDINERKKYEKQINESLSEKEILLQEIHHRVKNNLAIITSLLELQKEEIDDQQMQAIYRKSQSRIQSIAMVHEKLYQTDTLSEIDMSTYIEEFISMLDQAYESNKQQIQVELDLEPIKLDINNAVPCGLIFNELANNTYKHAFANRQQGTLKVSLNSDNDKVRLTVADNGQGLPENFSVDDATGLGMTLLKNLTKQLEGDIKISSEDKWTQFTVIFNN